MVEVKRCKHGHEQTDESVYITPAGKRQCRICKRDWLRSNRPRSERGRGRPARPMRERFDEKWRLDPETGCWIWTASKKVTVRAGSYGSFTVQSGKNQLAHRVAYELYVGPIPEGLELDHLCRRPECVNPAHLEPVDHRENLARGETHVATHDRRLGLR
jgi:hypothetical protein